MKPIIPREVADAIESFRSDEDIWDNARIIRCALGIGRPTTERSATVKAYARDNVDTLMAALVNGYEIEKSAEELAHDKIRVKYAGYVANAGNTYARTAANVLRETLDDLGIPIEGVNA